MLDQMQIVTSIPFLSTLLECPDFIDGLREGKQVFPEMFDEDEEQIWTEAA